jgi:SAM-dependent methyltransferase
MPGGIGFGTDPADLAAMEAGSRFTTLATEAPAGRGPVRLLRRLMYRLLYPLLEQQTAQAEATGRLVTQLASRMNVLERNASERRSEGWRTGELPMGDVERELRASEDTVESNRARYAELFEGRSSVLDVRCGRGELLALLKERAIEATGVDPDRERVDHCRSLGLRVSHGDGYTHLRSLQSSSLGGIFAAQVIERLTPRAVVSFVSLAATRLEPGGVLVIETVNPASLAALSSFYVDVTNVRPYDARMISHLLSSCGFVDVACMYLRTSDAREALASALEEVLGPHGGLPAIAADVADKLYGPEAYAVWGALPPA